MAGRIFCGVILLLSVGALGWRSAPGCSWTRGRRTGPPRREFGDIPSSHALPPCGGE